MGTGIAIIMAQRILHLGNILGVALLALATLAPTASVTPVRAQQAAALGTVTNLPIPRFVSLKPSDTPMREGPSKDHKIKWVFKQEGMPVEIIGEHEQWRRVRDFEGTDGWVYQARLSNRRTAIIKASAGQVDQPLLRDEREGSPIVARLQPGVIVALESCTLTHCQISIEGYAGYLKKEALWGVYGQERIR